MRIAIHHPARTEGEQEIPASVSAFRLGRVLDFVNPMTGETTSAPDVAAALLEQAKTEYPDCEVVLERLVDNGDGTSSWLHENEVPEGSKSPDGKVVPAPDLVASQGQGGAVAAVSSPPPQVEPEPPTPPLPGGAA